MKESLISGDTPEADTLYCSFCGKGQHEVRKLIAGPTVFICDECVELCIDIITESSGELLESERYPRYMGAVEIPAEIISGENAPSSQAIVMEVTKESYPPPDLFAIELGKAVLKLRGQAILQIVEHDIAEVNELLKKYGGPYALQSTQQRAVAQERLVVKRTYLKNYQEMVIETLTTA